MYSTPLYAKSAATRRTNQVVRLLQTAPPLREADVKKIVDAAIQVRRLDEPPHPEDAA
jgi:hypothetical protein